MIRIILCLLAVILMLILSLPVLLVLWLLDKKRPGAGDLFSLHYVQGMFKVVLFLAGTKITVLGKENIPADTAVLYVGNHRSIFDIVIGYSMMPSLTGYVAKVELEKIPILASWMRRVHCLFLDRKNLRQGMQTILNAIELIKSGISVCIYPEGTRSKGPDQTQLLEFHEGSFKIATRTGCPIIPMAISHSSAVFEDHIPFIRSTHVTVEYGKPIYPALMDKKEQKTLGVTTRGIICEMLRKNI